MSENENATTEEETKVPVEDLFEDGVTHLFKIDSIEHVVSSKKKTPGLQVTLICEAGGKEESRGKRIYDTIWLTAATSWKSGDFLGACKEDVIGPKDEVSLFRKFAGKIIKARPKLEASTGEDPKTGVPYPPRWKIGSYVNNSAKTVAEPNQAESGSVPF